MKTIRHVFLDTETTGLTSFDSILEVALIATDDQFNIIEERTLRCRRLPHIVPHPKALIINKASPDDLECADLSHFEAMSALAATLEEWGPATYWAHNMKFDLRMVREGLFSALLDPYLMSRRACAISDTLQMLRVVATVDPIALALPFIDGKVSMRLGPVLRANAIAFADEDAHGALADCRGAVALAKLIAERSPIVFRHMLSMASKTNAAAFLEENRLFRHLTYYGEPRFPLARQIAANPGDPNEVAIIDVTVDPAPLLAMSGEELAAAMMATPSRQLSTLRLNAMPALLPEKAIEAPGEPDDFTMAAYATATIVAPGFKERVREALRIRAAAWPRSPYIETQLYDYFPGYHDKRLREAFHAAQTWSERLELARHLEDVRLRTHALRIIHAEAPEALSEVEREQMDAWRKDRLLTQDNVPWTTIHKACLELKALRPELRDAETGIERPPTPEELALIARLDELEIYYLGLAAGHQ